MHTLAELDDETLIEWIGGALCVAEVAEERRDWTLYREAVRELDALCEEWSRRGRTHSTRSSRAERNQSLWCFSAMCTNTSSWNLWSS
jgi:hypothetical protein